jgi:uncharacterized membrane protein
VGVGAGAVRQQVFGIVFVLPVVKTSVELYPAAVTGSGRANRFTAFDRLRGLIMVLMAIDHASFFIARTHASEMWAAAPPFYASHNGASVAVSFLTRWVTHLCAPGFFMLMGAGMVWLGTARHKDGWSHARIRTFFVTRGLTLLVIQHVVENPAWLLGVLSAGAGQPSLVAPPGGGTNFIFQFGVISALGAAMIFWAFLIEMSSAVVLVVAGAALALSVVMTPLTGDCRTLFPAWRLLLFVPSHTNLVNVLYPFVPWLAPAGVGIVLARIVAKKPSLTAAAGAVAGAGLLAACVAMRWAGVGDPHAPLPGMIGFMSLTKYPPSPAFLEATLGVDLLLVAAFTLTVSARWLAPFEAFGRAPLFFYLLHLYVFGILSFAFPGGASFPFMYAVWAAAVVAMYPACLWYARFRASRPLESYWRLL